MLIFIIETLIPTRVLDRPRCAVANVRYAMPLSTSRLQKERVTGNSTGTSACLCSDAYSANGSVERDPHLRSRHKLSWWLVCLVYWMNGCLNGDSLNQQLIERGNMSVSPLNWQI